MRIRNVYMFIVKQNSKFLLLKKKQTGLREELYELELSGYFDALAPFAKHSIYIKLNI